MAGWGRRILAHRPCSSRFARPATRPSPSIARPRFAIPMPSDSISTRFGSGQAVRRVEDESLLTGRDLFTDNFAVADGVHLVFVRSPHAHARIAMIDTAAAAAAPGVSLVLTGTDLATAGIKPLPRSTDFKRADGRDALSPPQHALAVEV